MNTGTTTEAFGDSRAKQSAMGRRWWMVPLAALGPLAMVGWSLTIPYSVIEDKTANLVDLEANPFGAEMSTLMLLVFGVVGLASVLIVGAAVRRGAPTLGAVAMVVAFIGAGIAAYSPTPVGIAAGFGVGLDAETVRSLADTMDAQLPAIVAASLFVLLPLGILLLGIAAIVAARRGRFPWVGAVLLPVSIAAVLLGGLLGNVGLTTGWALVAAAFGFAGWSLAVEFSRAGSRPVSREPSTDFGS